MSERPPDGPVVASDADQPEAAGAALPTSDRDASDLETRGKSHAGAGPDPEATSESFPKFEEIADPPEPVREKHMPRWLPYAVVALVLLGSWVTYSLLTRADGVSDDSSLLQSLAEGSMAFRPDVQTRSASEAAQFVIDQFGWPIETPVVKGLELVGVGEITLSESVVVPGFQFQTADNTTATVAAYDYVFLDQVSQQFTLSPAIYSSLGDDPPVDTRRLGDYYLVSWRTRAVIYTAFTLDEATYELIGKAVR